MAAPLEANLSGMLAEAKEKKEKNRAELQPDEPPKEPIAASQSRIALLRRDGPAPLNAVQVGHFVTEKREALRVRRTFSAC